ncbi:MAG: hypothetical protein MUO77_18025 [Anaerolineales bacterium]|nr:hypothetical protein [Anaerolineales bacterium]
MPRLQKGGYSMRQGAYARRIWGGKDTDKKSIALDVGYSPSVSNTPHSKIEIHKGFNNAMAALAEESNNLALKILYEFKARGVSDFSNKDLIGALNAIGQAWGKFNAGALKLANQDAETLGKNRLRTIILQRVENQTISEINPLPQEANKVESVTEEEF